MSAGRVSVSGCKTWCTPQKYVDVMHTMFDGPPQLDPCSNEHSLVQAITKYVLPEQDGLVNSWNFTTIFVNPPYGRDALRGTTIKDWLKRCAEANIAYASEILALVPVATNTKHWKEYVFTHATAVAFLYDTRLRFLVNGTSENKGAPMACAMVYWGNNYPKFKETLTPFGAVLLLRNGEVI